MKDIEFKEIEYGSKEYKEELDLRNRVLRIPLGLDVYDDDLSAESKYTHLGAFAGNRLIGMLMLMDAGAGTVRMRQVAVTEEIRGQGTGKMLVAFAEEKARLEGYKEMILHARITATGFYQNLGYSITSDTFQEVGIPHVEMKKSLCKEIEGSK